jgi:hypothetical protein
MMYARPALCRLFTAIPKTCDDTNKLRSRSIMIRARFELNSTFGDSDDHGPARCCSAGHRGRWRGFCGGPSPWCQ